MTSFEVSPLAQAIRYRPPPAPIIVKPKQTAWDAYHVVAMAAKLHGTDTAVRKAALQMMDQVTPGARAALTLVLQSRNPLGMIELWIEEMDRDALYTGWYRRKKDGVAFAFEGKFGSHPAWGKTVWLEPSTGAPGFWKGIKAFREQYELGEDL